MAGWQIVYAITDTQQVILSIMARVKISTIYERLGTSKIVRTMPNLPAQMGAGMTVFTSTAEGEWDRIGHGTKSDQRHRQNPFTWNKRKKIDAATAVSGSGPAYVFISCNH